MLERIYFVAQIMAAMAIIASLVYVGGQLQQNTQIMRISAAQSHVAAFNTAAANLSRTDDAASIWLRGLERDPEMTRVHLVRFYSQLHMIMKMSESGFVQWQAGVLSDEEWEGMLHQSSDIMATPGGQDYWRQRGHWYVPKFRAWVENLDLARDGRPLYDDDSSDG